MVAPRGANPGRDAGLWTLERLERSEAADAEGWRPVRQETTVARKLEPASSAQVTKGAAKPWPSPLLNRAEAAGPLVL